MIRKNSGGVYYCDGRECGYALSYTPQTDEDHAEVSQALRSLQAEVERLRVLVGDMQPMAICWATHYATGRGFERHPTHANILDRARSALNTGSGEG